LLALSFVWAVAEEPSGHIAVVAENAKSFGIAFTLEPHVESRPEAGYFATVLVSAAVYMVDAQEFDLAFGAARAFAAIALDEAEFPPHPVLDGVRFADHGSFFRVPPRSVTLLYPPVFGLPVSPVSSVAA
jgi:hypothetical protein